MEMTWLLWAVYKAPLLSSFTMFITVYGKYALDEHLWSLRLAAFLTWHASLFIRAIVCYWILLCASRVYLVKSNKIWLASNVSLVESESCAPLVPLVGELMDSKVISTSFFKIQDFFFLLHAGDPTRCLENFKPCFLIYCEIKTHNFDFSPRNCKFIFLNSDFIFSQFWIKYPG